MAGLGDPTHRMTGFVPLATGDLITVISPASWLDAETLAAGAARLEGAGFRVRIDPQNYARWGRAAGRDEERADALHRAYADPETRAILIARGGYGSARLIETLDWRLIAQNPKPLVGYSDITALLLAIHRRTGQQPWHGPILKDFASGDGDEDQASCAHLVRMLRGEDDGEGRAALMRQARTLVPGRASGPIIGGNLSLLMASIGTEWAPDFKGAILFWEEVDEALYAIDRMLIHAHQARLFDGVAGMLVGEPVAVTQENDDLPFDFEGLVAEHFGDAPFPVATCVPCGHGRKRLTLPIGASSTLVAEPDGVRLAFSFGRGPA